MTLKVKLFLTTILMLAIKINVFLNEQYLFIPGDQKTGGSRNSPISEVIKDPRSFSLLPSHQV